MGRNRKILEISTGDLTKRDQAEKRTQAAMIVQDPADLDKLPQDLLDTKAKKEWKRVVPELKKMDIVGRLDISNLVAYCNAFSKYCEATKALRGQPLTVPSPSGWKENPLISVQLKYQEAFRKAADQCGLTINSRLKWAATKMKKQEEQIESEFGAI
jgi:P27 family predicted phage terminase small subunit